MYLAVCLGGYFLNEGDYAFVNVPLHPYLLIIALLGIQYGVTEALGATAVGLVLYLVKLQGSGLGEGYTPYILFSFVATGLLLGLTQESRNRQLRQTRSELEEVRHESERLRQRLQVVTAANTSLNERILGEVSTVQSFSEIARRLSVLEERDLYPALCELCLEFVHATEASVYMLTGAEQLVLTAQKGWSSIPDEDRSVARGRALLWAAVDQQKPVTGIDLDGPAPDPAAGGGRLRLICAPIVHPVTGQVMGVVSVDRLPFSQLHANSVSLLGVIARWAGDSLYNAATFREVATQLAGDDILKSCLPPVLFRDRIQQSLKTAPGALVCLLIAGYHSLGAEEQVELRRRLQDVFSRILDGRDLLGRLAQGVYGVFLPERSESQAEEFRERLLQELRGQVKPQFDGRAQLMVGVFALTDAELSLEHLLAYSAQQARMNVA